MLFVKKKELEKFKKKNLKIWKYDFFLGRGLFRPILKFLKMGDLKIGELGFLKIRKDCKIRNRKDCKICS